LSWISLKIGSNLSGRDLIFHQLKSKHDKLEAYQQGLVDEMVEMVDGRWDDMVDGRW